MDAAASVRDRTRRSVAGESPDIASRAGAIGGGGIDSRPPWTRMGDHLTTQTLRSVARPEDHRHPVFRAARSGAAVCVVPHRHTPAPPWRGRSEGGSPRGLEVFHAEPSPGADGTDEDEPR